MARFSRLEVLNTIIHTGLVPVFYHEDMDVVKNVVRSCYEGGLRILEFTNRGDFAVQVFGELERLCRRDYPEMITGIGSVLDSVSAGLFIASGANFVVGPVLNADVAKVCNRRKIAYSPGCGSASEISQAEELGCEIIKIFPGGQVGGPAFVKALKGPMPWTNLMPTGGVDITEESLASWFKAGVACVGIGSQLITKDLIEAKDWQGLRLKVENTLSIIRRLKKQG